jgi:hypothetical protein
VPCGFFCDEHRDEFFFGAPRFSLITSGARRNDIADFVRTSATDWDSVLAVRGLQRERSYTVVAFATERKELNLPLALSVRKFFIYLHIFAISCALRSFVKLTVFSLVETVETYFFNPDIWRICSNSWSAGFSDSTYVQHGHNSPSSALAQHPSVLFRW